MQKQSKFSLRNTACFVWRIFCIPALILVLLIMYGALFRHVVVRGEPQYPYADHLSATMMKTVTPVQITMYVFIVGLYLIHQFI